MRCRRSSLFALPVRPCLIQLRSIRRKKTPPRQAILTHTPPPDSRKLQSRLLTNWKYIPIEVAPIAAYRVLNKLLELGAIDPVIRTNKDLKQGPLKTDQDFFLIDAPFKPLLTKADVANGQDGSGKDGVWEVNALAREIKQITGVLDVGIFSGLTGPEATAAGGVGGQRPVAAYFGMPDGSVSVRKAI